MSDFDALFLGYYARLARLLYRVTGDTSRAEEFASEAFWHLHRNPPSSDSNVEGWLYRTGLRLALDHIRKERRRSYYEALASWFTSASVSGQDDEKACVKQVLASIKPQQAALLVLRNDGLTYAEIASALDLNPTSVGTLLSRAEEAFRKEYIKHYGSRG